MRTSGTAISQRERDVWIFETPETTPVEKRKATAHTSHISTLVSDRLRRMLGLDFLSFNTWGIDPRRTMLRSELTEEKNLYEGSAEEALPDEEADIPNVHRIRLLARRYARNSLTPEESARLDILSERVQQLVPSVTDEEVNVLGYMVSKLHDIAVADETLRKRLGMTE